MLVIAEKLISGQLTDDEVGMLIGFSLPLAAKRANDYSSFFKPYNSQLVDIKSQLSMFAGHIHSRLMNKDTKGAGEELKKLAEAENKFKELILAS